MEKTLQFRCFISLVVVSSVISCGGGGGDSSENIEENTGSGSGTTPGCSWQAYSSCSVSDNQYPPNLRSSYCEFSKLLLDRPTTDINFTSYYLEDSRTCYEGVHNGIDFQTTDVSGVNCDLNACPEHSILAPIEGEIIFKDITNGAVIISGEAINSQTNLYDSINYAALHMTTESFSSLVVGEYIYVGEVIGLQSDTGNVTGPHVHFEFMSSGVDRVNGNTVSDPDALNPELYLDYMLDRLSRNLVDGDVVINSVYVDQEEVSNPTIISYDGNPKVVRLEGTGFTPSTYIEFGGYNCRENPSTRGNTGLLDFVEFTCNSNNDTEANTFNISIYNSTNSNTLLDLMIITEDAGEQEVEVQYPELEVHDILGTWIDGRWENAQNVTLNSQEPIQFGYKIIQGKDYFLDGSTLDLTVTLGGEECSLPALQADRIVEGAFEGDYFYTVTCEADRVGVFLLRLSETESGMSVPDGAHTLTLQ